MTLERELLLIALAMVAALVGGAFLMIWRALLDLRRDARRQDRRIAKLEARQERGRDDGK